MKRLTTCVACLCMALYATAAYGDVAGSSAVAGGWPATPGTGSYASTITLGPDANGGTIVDITVGVAIDHTWASDLSMTLFGPGGTVTFNANQGGAGDYLSSGLGGSYFWNDAGIPNPGGVSIPLGTYGTSAPLNSAFATSDGVWTLSIVDTTGGDGTTPGGITGWSLSIVTAPPVIPEPTSGVLLGLVGGVILLRRRKR